MSTTITTILATDHPADSRTVINDNFASLNSNKPETTAMTAAITAATTGKADKVGSPTLNNFAGLDAGGNIKDSGSKASDFAVTAKGVTNGDTHDHIGGDGN